MRLLAFVLRVDAISQISEVFITQNRIGGKIYLEQITRQRDDELMNFIFEYVSQALAV